MGRTFVSLPDYEIAGRIGRGAGAIIYEARQRSSRQPVAIKHVVRHGPADERFIEQAETEYAVAHTVSHENLRRCLDVVRVRRWLKTRELFLIMELVEGEPLEQQLKPQPPPSEFDGLLDVFMQVAAGLHALHRQGFAHADIKPNNIIVSCRGGVKIIDFGQSCPLGHTKQRVQGTPDFIAPEQVMRQPIDQRTDVFNLGATMYWSVTRKWFRTMMSPAPTGAKKIEIDARAGNEPPATVNPAVPLPLSQLILDCCETRKDDRPREMSQVISRLEIVRHLLDRRRSDSAARGNR